MPGQTVKGRVYFTHNGRRQGAVMDDVNGGMWPVVHLQKKVQSKVYCRTDLPLSAKISIVLVSNCSLLRSICILSTKRGPLSQ